MFLLALIVTMAIHAWNLHKSHQERKTWIKALLSKDLAEFTAAEVAEILPKKEKTPPDLFPIEAMDDSDFYSMISKQQDKAANGK